MRWRLRVLLVLPLGVLALICFALDDVWRWLRGRSRVPNL